jgi:PII-like signaling protein
LVGPCRGHSDQSLTRTLIDGADAGGEKAALLRIFIGENDRFGQHPLYEAIVLKAREQGLAGATVLRGPMGFGHSSRLHTAKILRLSEDLPVVVEIIDSEQNITAFLPLLEEMVKGGLVSIEEVRILRYGPDRKLSSSTVAVEGS